MTLGGTASVSLSVDFRLSGFFLVSFPLTKIKEGKYGARDTVGRSRAVCGDPGLRLACFLGTGPCAHCQLLTPMPSSHRRAWSLSSLKESARSVSHSTATLITSVLDLAEFTQFLLAFPLVLIDFGAIIAYFGVVLCYTILRWLALYCGEG